ncbi:MAG TPA: hypothetical protein VGB36_01340 [Gammaproteobacteria bacterium]|jgi:hypothetical protein
MVAMFDPCFTLHFRESLQRLPARPVPDLAAMAVLAKGPALAVNGWLKRLATKNEARGWGLLQKNDRQD